MATATINVLIPALEQVNPSNKLSAEVGVAAAGNGTTLGTKVSVNATATDITINDAMANKNNSMYIIANITTVGDYGTITIKAGNAYPNRCLGDYKYTCSTGYNAILLEDISRFENDDNTIVISTGSTLVGDIFVVGKRVGVDSVANQNARDAFAGRTLHYDPSYTG